MMIINKFDFNIYKLFIILAFLIPLIISTIYLINKKVNKIDLIYSIFIITISSLTFGKLFTIVTFGFSVSFRDASLSSYGGFLGVLIVAFFYSSFIKNKEMRNIYIIIIPLMYSISKLGCFFSGCCYGIPYNGIGKIKYPHFFDEYLFPIQLLEVITFLILFLFLFIWYKKKSSKYIIEITMIMGALLKGLLDYLRYSHLNQIISINQIVSLFIIIISLISIFIRYKTYSKYK